MYHAGRDQPFVNNYGVWTDEYSALGLGDTLNARWDDAVCYFGEGREVRVGRSYGRVCRRKLRARLLQRCKEHGVRFLAGEVASITCKEGASASRLSLQDGTMLSARSAPAEHTSLNSAILTDRNHQPGRSGSLPKGRALDAGW